MTQDFRYAPPEASVDDVAASGSGGNTLEGRKVITRFGVLASAKISGALYTIAGLVIGAIFSLAALAGGAGEDAQGLFGPMAIVLVPIFYGVGGFIASLIGAALYNLLAGLVGGVEIDLGS